MKECLVNKAGTLIFQQDSYYSDCAITTTPVTLISTKQPCEVHFASADTYTEYIAGRFIISDLWSAQWLHFKVLRILK